MAAICERESDDSDASETRWKRLTDFQTSLALGGLKWF